MRLRVARSIAAAAALLLLSANEVARADSSGFERIYPQLTTWDLDAVVGGGYTLGDGSAFALLRGRAGVLIVREPRFWSLGATGEYLSGRRFALGVEGGLVDDASGYWTQLGASRALVGDAWSAHGAVGWALFGVELRRETGARAGWQIAGELRIPIGILVHKLKHR